MVQLKEETLSWENEAVEKFQFLYGSIKRDWMDATNEADGKISIPLGSIMETGTLADSFYLNS